MCHHIYHVQDDYSDRLQKSKPAKIYVREQRRNERAEGYWKRSCQINVQQPKIHVLYVLKCWNSLKCISVRTSDS